MYLSSYKINNSYTTYVIHGSNYQRNDNYYYNKPAKKLEWKNGAKVQHYFYGTGVINAITNNHISVHFKNAKLSKKYKAIQVSFEYKKDPSEIESLRLCY